MKTWC